MRFRPIESDSVFLDDIDSAVKQEQPASQRTRDRQTDEKMQLYSNIRVYLSASSHPSSTCQPKRQRSGSRFTCSLAPVSSVLLHPSTIIHIRPVSLVPSFPVMMCSWPVSSPLAKPRPHREPCYARTHAPPRGIRRRIWCPSFFLK